ncbi:TPA: LysR family transcriptional regulator [Pseudomonas putida]|uniref:LysR family transcriptional regulator n=1 Tax=Pseudomonas putida TaxID=303 RepID=A0AAP9MZZ9_PSEPU|nr:MULTISPECIES: LysR family transcriptional regulator [Pseudomonas]MCS4061390.1 DNA-binding transcriptional LysR family regulator [Pseudomonas putida]MDD1993633.1 LysR family transcriptional regulator [Pseudomonas putida]QJQ10261.1 LysR family transcriptional regulator [Pseudomonas putida]HDS0916461.1 LysR family transcriptional regulator [Pseudomonas putida]HDS0932096.1 LysR family transcriptional regulator [Pseudomonas putida]
MFDWDSLRYFNAFVREGSLAAAARSLGVEHATIARRISALEAALNLKLVDRRGRLYELTQDGLRVGEYAALMESASFALERFVEGEESRVEGELTLSAPPAFLGTLVARRLGELRARHPLLQLRLVGAKSTASLARKETDIAITFTRPQEQSVIAKKLGTLRFFPYATEDYLAKNVAADHEFIGYDRSMGQSIQQRWLLDHLKGRRVSVTSNDLRIQALAAAGGAGVVYLPDFLAAEHALVKADTECPPLELPIWLAFHEDLRSSIKIRVVVEFLMQGLETTQIM